MYRIRTGRKEWPDTSTDAVTDVQEVPGRKQVGCTSCATIAYESEYQLKSWDEVMKANDMDKRMKVRDMLSVETYLKWINTELLLMPREEVKRASVIWDGPILPGIEAEFGDDGPPGRRILLHTRQLRRSGALIWSDQYKDMILNTEVPVPWCAACLAELRRGKCPRMALANGMLGGRENKTFRDKHFGKTLAVRRARANVKQVFLSEKQIRRMGNARPESGFDLLQRGLEGNTIFFAQAQAAEEAMSLPIVENADSILFVFTGPVLDMEKAKGFHTAVNKAELIRDIEFLQQVSSL